MTSTPDQRHAAEYEAIRATIGERGAARIILVPIVFIGWPAVAVATTATITVAMSTLVPLMVLAGGFEAVFALHTNVERIGRYLQAYSRVFRRGVGAVIIDFSTRFPASGPDPLARLFILRASVNFIPVALGGAPAEAMLVAVFHLLFLYRVRTAQRTAASQRADDLRKFHSLRDETAGGGPPEHE